MSEPAPVKLCTGCSKEKPLTAFVPDRRKPLGVTSRCRLCRNTASRTYRAADPVRYRSYGSGKEYQREWRLKNLAKSHAHTRAWREKIRDKIAAAARRRRRDNRQYKVLSNLRGRLNDALRRGAGSKRAGILVLLGCTIPELIQRFEAKFQPGMSWDNYGKGEGKWHIDHIRPCCTFNLTDADQQAACFHFSNLRPLWERENLSLAHEAKKQSVWS